MIYKLSSAYYVMSVAHISNINNVKSIYDATFILL